MFSLKLFGGACIFDDGGALTGSVAQRRRLALLALLATSSGQRLGRERVCAYLWPESDTEHARASLVDAVYALRRGLGREALLSVGGELWLDPERVHSDVGEFARAVAHSEHKRAVELYAGPFLDGFFVPDAPDFESWVEGERKRLARDQGRALEALASQHEAAGDHQAAADYWGRLAAHDPYSSRVALRFMRALTASGDRAAAIRCAREHQTRLRDEIGTDPDPEILSLVQQLCVRTPESAPPAAEPRADSRRRDKLPVAETGAHAATEATQSHEIRTAVQPAAWSHFLATRQAALWLAVMAGILLAVVAFTFTAQDPVAEQTAHRSLIVLPFADLSPGRDHEYFSDGLTDELINSLARVDGLRVVARTSAFTFKGKNLSVHELARRLQVGYVLEGSVRRGGDRVRISAQLINARTGYPMWSETFDRHYSDIFAVQQEISRAISGSLELEFGRGPLPGTADPDAYDLYLQGRYHWNLGSVDDASTQDRALHFYRRAIERDPAYALAFAGMADAYSHANRPQLAKAAALRAVSLDSMLPEARIALAYPLAFNEWEWQEAERELSRALELNPNSVLAFLRRANVLAALGRADAAIADAERASRMEPLSFIVSYNRGLVYYWAGRYDEAVRYLRHTLAMDDSRQDVRRELAHAHFGRGDMAEAAALYRSTGDTIFAVLATGTREELERVIRWAELEEERMSPATRANFYARLGMHDEALEALRRAVTDRDRWVPFHMQFPALAPLRSDVRFQRLRQQVGLQQP
jgi:adenylate cyclase